MTLSGFLIVCIPVIAGIFAAWGMLWYRLGKLSQEVREHNKLLGKIKRKVEALAVKEGVDCE